MLKLMPSPLKSQSIATGGINVCLADGSVRMVRAGVTDEQWCNSECPALGELNLLEQ